MEFDIKSLHNKALEKTLHKKVRRITCNEGALSIVEHIAIQLGLIQDTEVPLIKRPAVLLFAGDHRISYQSPFAENISTPGFRKVLDFLDGKGAAIALNRQLHLPMRLIDCGLDHNFEGNFDFWLHHGGKLINSKLAYASKSFDEYPAMSSELCAMAMEIGVKVVEKQRKAGSNFIALAHFGSGAEPSAIALCCTLLKMSPFDFLKGEAAVFLDKAIKKHPLTHDPMTLLTFFGGLEIAAMAGACLQAAQNKMGILISDHLAASALLVAYFMNPMVLNYCLFASSFQEGGWEDLFKYLKAKPIHNATTPMADGVAAVTAFPLINMASQLMQA